MRWLVVGVFVVGACKREEAKQAPPLPPPSSPPSQRELAPLGPRLEADEPVEGAAPITIGFDWGPPCRIPVLEDVEQDDGREPARGRFAYEVMFERVEGRLVAKIENMRLVSMLGAEHDRDAQRATAALNAVIPPIAVTDTGESDGALDIEQAIDRALSLVAKNVKDPQATANLAAMLRAPQWKEAFAQKAGETWDVWIGAWTGLDLEPGIEETMTIDLPSVLGTLEDVPVTTTHHGSVRGAPNLILVSIETVIEGPQLAKMVGGFAQSVSGQKFDVKNARKVDRSKVALDPMLGRPHRARHEVDVTFEGRRKHTVRDTAFDWSKAVGCKVAEK